MPILRWVEGRKKPITATSEESEVERIPNRPICNEKSSWFGCIHSSIRHNISFTMFRLNECIVWPPNNLSVELPLFYGFFGKKCICFVCKVQFHLNRVVRVLLTSATVAMIKTPLNQFYLTTQFATEILIGGDQIASKQTYSIALLRIMFSNMSFKFDSTLTSNDHIAEW